MENGYNRMNTVRVPPPVTFILAGNNFEKFRNSGIVAIDTANAPVLISFQIIQ
jgi:NADPH-dependent 2,4-dienoyl-CoA reductase/sulfur reductase-like enzyme